MSLAAALLKMGFVLSLFRRRETLPPVRPEGPEIWRTTSEIRALRPELDPEALEWQSHGGIVFFRVSQGQRQQQRLQQWQQHQQLLREDFGEVP